MDDAGLVEAWRKGDRKAGAAIIERHFESLYHFFRNKVSGDVDDLVQQTFVGCLEARDNFRGECAFRTLMFRVARRRLYDHYRERQKLRGLDFTTASVRALGTSPSAAVARRDELSVLRDVLQELPADAQMLLELRYWEGLSTRALSQVFDVSEGTIKSRQFQARARLKALLAARGYVVKLEAGARISLMDASEGRTHGAYIRTHRAGSAIDWRANQGTRSSSGEGAPRSSSAR